MGSGNYNRKIMPVSAWRKHRGAAQKSNLQCFQDFRLMGWEIHTKIPLPANEKPQIFVQQYLSGTVFKQAAYLVYGRGMVAIAYE